MDWFNLITSLVASILGAVIGGACTWKGISIQEKHEKEKETEENYLLLEFQINEQISLCQELKSIELDKPRALNKDLSNMEEIWSNLYNFRHGSDLSIIKYTNNSKSIKNVLKTWRKLWNQYGKTCKSISATYSTKVAEERTKSLQSLNKSKQYLNQRIDDYCEALNSVLDK